MMMTNLPINSSTLTHEPATLNISHYKGDTFQLLFTYKAKASPSAQQYSPISLENTPIKATIYHPTTLAPLDTFTSTTPADTVTITPSQGQVLWEIPPTRLAQWGQNTVKFDIKLLKPNNHIQTLIKGTFTFTSL